MEPLPDDFREQLRDLLDDRRNSLYISEDDELEYSDSDDESYIECDNDDEKSECDDKYEDDFLQFLKLMILRLGIVMKYQFVDFQYSILSVK